jgi:hypothetical protein
MSDPVLAALISAVGSIVATTISAIIMACAPIIRRWVIRKISERRKEGDGVIPVLSKEAARNWLFVGVFVGAFVVIFAILWFILPRPTNCSYHTDNGSGDTEMISFTQCRAAKIHIDLKQRALVTAGFSLWEVEAYESTCSPRTGADNLVLGGKATASSVEHGDFAYYRPNYASDGQPQTRWSSEFSNPQWLEIDLPDSQVGKPISCVVLHWEAAFAVKYNVTILPSK